MRLLPQNNKYAIPVLVVCGILSLTLMLGKEWQLTGRLDGVPLDDSWIHYQFADNLRNGFGFSFNPGEPTPGSTSPLWVVLLSAIGFGYVIPAKLLGMLAFLGCGWMIYVLLREAGVDPGISLLCGVGIYGIGRFAWAAPSGMETTIFAFVSLLGIWLWVKDLKSGLRPLTAVVFGLACLLRPEGYLLLVLAVGGWTIFRIGNRSLAVILKNLFLFLVISGLTFAPYLIFSYLTTGQVFTSTFYVKSSTWGCKPGLDYFGWITGAFLLDNPVALIFGCIGALQLAVNKNWKDHPILFVAVGWWLLLPLAYGYLAPCISSYYLRYTTPVLPMMMIAAGQGAQGFGKWLQERRGALKPACSPKWSPRLPASLLAEGSLISLLLLIIFWMPFYGHSVNDITSLHVRMGNWLSANTEQDSVLAVNDVGAIGYFSEREIIDLGGLVTAEVVPIILHKQPGEWDEGLAEYLALKKPAYLVIFPEWYPMFEQLLPVQELYSLQLDDRQFAGLSGVTVVAGGGRMVVYRLDW